MILAAIFVIICLAALFLMVYLAKGRHSSQGNLDELASQLRPIDVDAFRNLTDERDSQFLRERLPAAEFRSIHRERMLAAADYVWGAARNAAILIRLAEAARQNEDSSIVATADSLLANAIRLRLYAFQAVPRLYLGALFPGAKITPEFMSETYGTMTRQVIMLGCLRYPTRGMSSAL